MKEYIVTQDILNIRSSATDVGDDNFIGQLSVGETLYLTDDEIIGVIPKGGTKNIWKTDNLNRLVALDGVRLKNYADKKAEFIADPYNQGFIDPADPNDESKWKVSWGIVDLEVWKIWRDYNTQGEGITIAVIDTGVISDNNDLNGRISNKSMSIISESIQDNSTLKHGTMSAGLIGADGATASTVYGIAPKCELIVIKAGDDGYYPIDIYNAINKAKDLGADIVSISIECYDQIQNLKTFFTNCKTSEILFFAAVGDMGNQSISYPASYDGCFSVGSYGLDDNKNRITDSHNNKNEFIKFLCPGVDILTCSPTSTPVEFNYSSAATAFASGLMALVISASRKGTPNFNSLLNSLQSNNCTENISENPVLNMEGYGVLIPQSLINNLT